MGPQTVPPKQKEQKMSGKEDLNLFGTSREAEEQHLKETLALIRENVERYSRDVSKNAGRDR